MTVVREVREEKHGKIVLTTGWEQDRIDEETAALRKENMDGMIRDERGRAEGQRVLSIPTFELKMLLDIKDEDVMIFWMSNDHEAKARAMRRLAIRFPHWYVVGGKL